MTPVERVHDDFVDATYDVLHFSDASPKEIATDINVPMHRLYQAVLGDCQQPFHASWIVPITKRTKNYAIVRFICRAVGGVFVLLPAKASGSLAGMTTALSDLMKEVSDVIRIAGESISDGALDRTEKANLLEQLREMRGQCDALEAMTLAMPDTAPPHHTAVITIKTAAGLADPGTTGANR